MKMESPDNTIDFLLQLDRKITDAIGACQRSLNKLSITPELLSLNMQKSSLAAAEAQFKLASVEIPSDLVLEQANLKKEMVFIKYATQRMNKSNAAREDLVSTLRQDLKFANEEYWSMKTVIDGIDKKQLKFFIMKQDEYVKRAIAIKEKMISNGITNPGQYKSIIDCSINVNKSETDLAELANVMKQYGNLPPNIQEAKIKLTEAKAKIKALNQQLHQKIAADIVAE